MPKRLSVKNAQLIKKHFYILKTLKNVDKRQRLKILKNAPNTLYKVLDIIFRHCITGVIPLDNKHLKQHRKFMKANSNKPISAIKKRLIQEGGAFPLLLSGLIPIIGSLLSKVLK